MFDSFLRVQPNLLEEIEYDSIHGVSPENSRNIAAGYIKFFKETLGAPDRPIVLEVGSGTGLLGLGLAINKYPGLLIVTDASAKFILANVANFQTHVGARDDIVHLCCSLESMPIQLGSIDLIVGNSVLHHIYDYRSALTSMGNLLRDGGLIVLSEPVVQGKFITALIVRLMLEIDKRLPNPQFVETETIKLGRILISHSREFWIEQAESKKDTADDKHLFDLNEIQKVGRAIGFSGVMAFPVMPLKNAIENNLVSALCIQGLSIPRERYNYICDAIRDILVPHVEGIAYPNHAFLAFRK